MADIVRCSCTRINDPWRRFCGGCGKGLAPACRCGFVNAKHDRFCGGCGSAVMNVAPMVKPVIAPQSGTIPIDIRDIVGETNS